MKARPNNRLISQQDRPQLGLSARIDGGAEEHLHKDSSCFQWKVSLVICKQGLMTFAAGGKVGYIYSRGFNR